ncbi:autotransporter outer membrane beta-barrel domain-containing protein [Pandoraea bronchicola]|uniref:autotransporter outer membrane beta-barrel domain-containing protein n=1 Tax=Pandoraea bronchicola TaxID=2508287 RepID=UPI0015814DE0|nr:autotransporter outer membrane beta-barrel domain-containing protein [Pandoraea bronchicola]
MTIQSVGTDADRRWAGGIVISNNASLEAMGDLNINLSINGRQLNRDWWAGISVDGASSTSFTLAPGARLTMNIDGTHDPSSQSWAGITLDGYLGTVTLNGPVDITVRNSDNAYDATSAAIFVAAGKLIGTDTTIKSYGGSWGVYSSGSGSVTLSGHIDINQLGIGKVSAIGVSNAGKISITGDGNSTIQAVSTAVKAFGGSVSLKNISIGSGGTVVNVSGTTSFPGAFDATDVAINSSADGASGVFAVGTTDHVALFDSQIKTTGDRSIGVTVGGTGGVTLDSAGASLDLSKSKIETYGDHSSGVALTAPVGTNSSLRYTRIRTYGGNSTGIHVGWAGGHLDVSQSDVTTQGDNSTGIQVDAGALTVGGQSVIKTQGLNSPAVNVSAGGNVSIADTQITTLNDGSPGVAISGGTAVLGGGTIIETSGTGAAGVVISDPGAALTINPGAMIKTHGQDANGFSLSGGGAFVFDAQGLQLSNISSDHGALIYADGGSAIEITAENPFAPRTSTILSGVPANWGAVAGQGGTITLDAGVSTNGNAMRAVAGGTLVFKGTSSAADSIVQLDAPLPPSTGTASVAGGKLDATTHDATLAIGALTGNGEIAVRAGTTIALGSDQLKGGGPYRFSGSFTGGSVDIDKAGANTQVLAGDQTWSGINTAKVDGGVLVITGLTDPSTFNKTITIGNGWLDLSGTNAQFDPNHPNTAANWNDLNLQYSPGGTGGVIGSNDKIDVADGDISYHIGHGGTTPNGDGVYVVKNGAGLTTLQADNSYVGNTQINGGTLQVSRDSNLGNTSIEREVRLQGGNLRVATDASGTPFTSSRELQVTKNATVTVDAGVDATFGSAATYVDSGGSRSAGGDATFIKDGTGSLTLGYVALSGGLVVTAGNFTASGGTISQANGGPAISAAGGANVSLSGVTVDGGAGLAYDLTSAGSSTLTVSGASLIKGNINAGVTGANVHIKLSGGSEFDGAITQSGGGSVNATLADTSSVWNLSGDSTVQQLANSGTITFATPYVLDGVPQHKTLSIAGDYAGGGTIGLNTSLNVGGAQGQQTDKVLISGNASGTTQLHVTASGMGANTNVRDDNKAHADEGISLVQVGGNATATSFQLDRPYVTGANSAYQYRLFAYGTGSTWGAADPTQSALPNGDITWDYRLQTAYEDDRGNITPGTPKNNPGRPLLVPQVSSYLIAPLVLQRYSAALMDGLHSRLGDIRHGGGASPVGSEAFARVFGDTGSYATNLPFTQFGYGYDERTQALQFGGNVLRYTTSGGDALRVGVAAAIGSVHATPRASAANNSSDLSMQAQTLALTATWMSREGWYADAVLGGSFYRSSVNSLSRNVGTLYGTGWDLALEGGRQIELPSGLMLEPRVQLLGHTANFRHMTDADGVSVSINSSRSITAGTGMRVSYPVQGATSTVRPYVDIGWSFTQMYGGEVNLTGLPSLMTGNAGGAIQLAAGVVGQISDRLQAYAEISGQIRTGGYGNSGVGGKFAIRYEF